MECDKKRNITTNKDVIITKPPDDDDSEEVQPTVIVNPVVPTFPTKSGITEQGANTYCKEQIEGLNVYKACISAIGSNFVVTGYIEQCVADIQV